VEPSVKDSHWIESVIVDFIDHSPENTLENECRDKAFGTPLVGFSRGDDPLYEAYKDHVGPFYLTPWEVFAINQMDPMVKPEELTVISWILPHNPKTKADNRKENRVPAERWARGRIMGEKVNEKLRQHVVESLAAEGIQAVAPSLTPQFSVRISPKYGFASTWSERHAAYASGLGTFGLCDGLITPVGKAMRTASVVARIQVPATPRPYTDHHAYCLFFSQGTCKKCIARCPATAISEKGKDKGLCAHHLLTVTQPHVSAHYGFDGYGCGLCQTKVPCESKIPVKGDLLKDEA
jgi:epoxyqueuosine reductase